MWREKPRDEVTWFDIVLGALGGIALATAFFGPLVWIGLENIDAIRAFGARLYEHLPDLGQ
jgi:hypothetical protein